MKSRGLARGLDERSGWVSVTGALVAVNVVVWMVGLALGGLSVLTQGSPLDIWGELYGPAVAAGEWWRLVTDGFLHIGIIHLGLNMAVLAMLGPPLEQTLGRVRFVALYLLGLVAASVGPLLISPAGAEVGASGAIFALMGATLVGRREIGPDPRSRGIWGLLIGNLVFTFAVPNISVGGHLGGLAGGLLGGLVLFRLRLHPAVSTLLCLLFAAGCAWLAIWLASNPLFQ